MKITPCINACPERNPGCHDHCERYISWRKEFDRQQEKVKRLKETDSAIESLRSRRRG